MRNVRVIYKKLGRMKYVSHLDMNRYIPRLVKVAKIPAKYTEGFNRHLCLTFALPLSLGTESDYDMFDIKIVDDDYTDEMVADALRQNAAEGIEIVSVGPIKMNATELKFAAHTVVFKDEDTDLLKDLEWFLNGNVIIATKKGKKCKVTEVNVAEHIKSISTELADNTLTVKVVLPAGNTGNLNPVLLLNAYCEAGNRRPQSVSYYRDMLYTENMEIFA